MENNPRAVFERLFGDDGSTDTAARLARMKRNRSMLDSVSAQVAGCNAASGPRRIEVTEYLEGDPRRRAADPRREEQSDRELPRIDRAGGHPATFEEHAKLMFDLQVLAYQSDLTRVITFMMARELSSRAYPEIGVPDAHHPLSHENSAGAQAQLLRINKYHARLFAYYLKRLSDRRRRRLAARSHDALYGCGMSDGDHRPGNLPMVLLSGAIS